MQPVRITIEGDFWDSQLYRDKLYLWTMENDLWMVDWSSVVESFRRRLPKKADLPLFWLFESSDYLYTRADRKALSDPAIRRQVEVRFRWLAKQNLTITETDLEKHGKRVASPFPVLADDADVYFNRFCAATEQGLYSTRLEDDRSLQPPTKLWDGGANSLKIGTGGRIALAASADGLYEVDAPTDKRDVQWFEPHRVAEQHVSFANWNHACVFATSLLGPSYMAAYHWVEKGENEPKVREFLRLIESNEIFETETDAGLTWGMGDKLYLLSENRLEIVGFVQKNLAEEAAEAFRTVSYQKLKLRSHGPAIGAGVTVFGTIIEYGDALVLLDSMGREHVLDGPVTRWRVFPRSIRYCNQVHVVGEEALTINSFASDWFVEQKQKRFGTRHSPRRPDDFSAEDLFSDF